VSEARSLTALLEETRPKGASAWDLPPWGHVLGMGIYPLLIQLDSEYIPMGTAFCMSRLGIMATAMHNVREAFKHHPRGSRLLAKRHLEGNFDLGGVGLSVLHNSMRQRDRLTVNLWPLLGAVAAPPTDLVFAQSRIPAPFAFMPLPISLGVPRIGSKVLCVGYCDTKIDEGDGRLRLESPRKRGLDGWEDYYHHRLRVVEGSVTEVFLQGFAPSYASGACFAIDAPVDHGMSGGPAINEAGFVCGITWASGIAKEGTSLISLLYPAFLTSLPFGFDLQDGRFRFNSTQPMMHLIARGAIVTDGSERLVHFKPEENRWRIGPLVHRDDWKHVFDDGHGLEEKKPSAPEAGGAFRLRRRPDDSDSEPTEGS